MLILDFSVVAEFLPILTGFFAFREFLLFFFLTFWPFFFLNSKSDFGDSGFRVVIISSVNPSEIIVVVLPSPFSSSLVWILFTVVISISVLTLVSMLLLLLLVVSKVTPLLLSVTPLILSVILSDSIILPSIPPTTLISLFPLRFSGNQEPRNRFYLGVAQNFFI